MHLLSAACLQQSSISFESFLNVRKTIIAKMIQSKTMQLTKTHSQNVSLESLACCTASSHVSPESPDPLISAASAPVEITDSRPKKVHSSAGLLSIFSCFFLFFCPSPLPFGGSTVLRLTRGPAGNRTTTGSLSAPSRTTPYQLSHEDACFRDSLGFVGKTSFLKLLRTPPVPPYAWR